MAFLMTLFAIGYSLITISHSQKPSYRYIAGQNPQRNPQCKNNGNKLKNIGHKITDKGNIGNKNANF